MKIKNEILSIATPTADGLLQTQYVRSLMGTMSMLRNQTHTKNSQIITFFTEGTSNIVHGRDDLISDWYFNLPTSNYFLWADGDMVFHPDDVFKLWKFLHEKKGKIVAGIGCKKRIDWNVIADCINAGVVQSADEILPIANEYCARNIYPSKIKGEFATTDFVGTGFMMISKALIDDLYSHYKKEKKMYFKFKNTFDAIALHTPILENGEYFAEDYSFCKRVVDMGETIYVDTNLELGHIGRYLWTGKPSIHMERHPKYSGQNGVKNVN